MGLADHDVGVTLGFEEVRQGGEVGQARGAVFDSAVDGRVESRDEAGAGWHADGGGRVGLGEQDAFGGQTIQMGGYGVGVTHTLEGVPPLGVGGDQEDVGFVGHYSGTLDEWAFRSGCGRVRAGMERFRE